MVQVEVAYNLEEYVKSWRVKVRVMQIITLNENSS